MSETTLQRQQRHMEIIIDRVAKHYGVCPDDITSNKVSHQFDEPRSVAVYLSRMVACVPSTLISYHFNKRGDSSVTRIVKKFRRRAPHCTTMRYAVLSIQPEIYAELAKIAVL